MTDETFSYETWVTGSDPVATTTGTLASGQSVEERTPLGQITASGLFTAWDPTAEDGSETAVRLSAIAIDASSADTDGPMIKAGTFNPDLVNWPDGTTDVQKLTAFVGTPISLQAPNEIADSE